MRAWLDLQMQRLECLFGFLWLYIYSILILVVGVIFAAWVPQARDLFSNLLAPADQLVEAKLNFHFVFWLLALSGWMAAIWYAMRVLVTRQFPGDALPAQPVEGFAHWLSVEFPRLAAFGGFIVVVHCASVFLGPTPSAKWLPYLAVGLMPLIWIIARLGDWIFRHRGIASDATDYRYSSLVVSLLGYAIALSAWDGALVAQEREHGLMALLRLPLTAGAADIPRLQALVLGLSAIATVAGMVLRTGARATTARVIALGAWVVAALMAGFDATLWLPIGLLAVASLALWYSSRRRKLRPAMPQEANQRRPQLENTTVVVLWLTIVLLLALVIGFAYFPVPLGKYLGTLAIAFLGLSLWCFFGTVIFVLLPKRRGWPSLAAVPLVWAILVGQPANHDLRSTDYKAAARPMVDAHFMAWRETLPDPKKSPIVFVAASGGGLRAGFWAAHVLAAADDATCGEFGRHVYAYSGVSGGSLGVAAYLTQRQVWAAKPVEERCKKGRVAEMTRLLGRDFLGPVGGSMVFAEATQLLSPFTWLRRERGVALADGWRDAWRDTFKGPREKLFETPFLGVFEPTASQPAVFLNATAVNSGRRVIASNVMLKGDNIDELFFATERHGMTLRTQGLALSDAVLNSARFTYVSPAGTVLGCKGRGCEGRDEKVWDRVVDGGYFENSGIATLRDVMRALDTDESPQARGYANPVFTVVIQNSRDEVPVCGRFDRQYNLRNVREHDTRPSDRAEVIRRVGYEVAAPAGEIPALSETTAPLEAMLNVREGRAALEARRLRSEVSCRYIVDWSLAPQMERAAAKDKRDFAEPPLGWFLSVRSAAGMVEAARDYGARLPFELAACDDGKKATRGLLGDPKLDRTAAGCPPRP